MPAPPASYPRLWMSGSSTYLKIWIRHCSKHYHGKISVLVSSFSVFSLSSSLIKQPTFCDATGGWFPKTRERRLGLGWGARGLMGRDAPLYSPNLLSPQKHTDSNWVLVCGFPAKLCLRNKRRSSILMRRHYPDLGSTSVWVNQISNQSEALLRSG